MSSLTWNPNQAAGIRMLDDQHGVLLDALKELRSALALGQECAAVRLHLNRIAELARLHLESESRLLEQHAFPDLAAYRAEHRQLLDRLELLPACPGCEGQTRQSSSVSCLADFLQEWFVGHTLTASQCWGPWLHQHGVR